MLNPFSIFSLKPNNSKPVRTGDTARAEHTVSQGTAHVASQSNAHESTPSDNPFLFKPALPVDASDSDDEFAPNPQSSHNLARLFGSAEANFKLSAPTNASSLTQTHDRRGDRAEPAGAGHGEGDRLASARAKLALYAHSTHALADEAGSCSGFKRRTSRLKRDAPVYHIRISSDFPRPLGRK